LKRLDLERHLRAHGCVMVREGENHAIWKNPANGNVRAVCRQLEITKP
jgi:hypothetical protein